MMADDMTVNIEKDPLIQRLSESLVDEVVGATGLPRNRFNHWLMGKLIKPVTKRFAHVGLNFERLIREDGFPTASAWALSLFCKPAKTRFLHEIPQSGPLLVAANHPGAYDALVYASKLGRKDVNLIATEIPYLRLLPLTSSHLIYAARDNSTSRMVAMRQIIRHLRSGGAMIYFASGHRDPDTAFYPGAEKMIDSWLPVFNFFYKYVPGLKILPAIGSGILSEHWAYHPVTRVRRKQIDRHRLAEFGQVISQLAKPGKLLVTPAVSFGRAVSQGDLEREGVHDDFQSAVVAQGKSLLHDHAQHFDLQYT